MIADVATLTASPIVFIDETENAGICQRFARDYSLELASNSSDIDIVDGYVGEGYALFRQEELQAIYDLSLLEGVVLDPVYTGGLFGLFSCR